MILVIAKMQSGRWILRSRCGSITEAMNYKERFEQSMNLLGINECRVVEPSNIANYNELGWENNIKVKK